MTWNAHSLDKTGSLPIKQVAFRRSLIVGMIGFLTLVDLFATQAILPSLAKAYGVSPAAAGLAVNASTAGMAVSCLGVVLIGRSIDNRAGIWISLFLLAVPTSLLAMAPDIMTFTVLRVAQGVFMASAFTLTMAYLAENCSTEERTNALAAYVTGVVASNLVGRLVSASVADSLGLAANFYLFAGLNLAGAALVYGSFSRMVLPGPAQLQASWSDHLRNPVLVVACVIAFLILFSFIGIFTYVNFVLVRSPIALSAMSLGFVYIVFLPSMLSTPIAGRVALRFGSRAALWGGLAVAAAGLPLLLIPNLFAVLTGMVIFAVGTFFTQAVGTGLVGRAVKTNHAAASGLYLASYYIGGLCGAAAIGQLFDRFGWSACVGGVAIALVIGAVMALRLKAVEK